MTRMIKDVASGKWECLAGKEREKIWRDESE